MFTKMMLSDKRQRGKNIIITAWECYRSNGALVFSHDWSVVRQDKRCNNVSKEEGYREGSYIQDEKGLCWKGEHKPHSLSAYKVLLSLNSEHPHPRPRLIL